MYSVLSTIPPMPVSFEGRDDQMEGILSVLDSQAVRNQQARGGGSGNQRSPKPSCMTLGVVQRLHGIEVLRFASMHHSRIRASGLSTPKINSLASSPQALTSTRRRAARKMLLPASFPSNLYPCIRQPGEHSGMMKIRDFDELLQSLFEVPILQLMVTIHGTLPESKVWGTWKEIELDKLDPTSALNGFLCLSDIQEQHFYSSPQWHPCCRQIPALAIVPLASQATREFGLEQLWEEWNMASFRW